MSSLNPPRRSPRKRSRGDSISDSPEKLSATASFTAKISKFANDSSSTNRTRSIPSGSAAKVQHDCSVDGPVSVVTKTASATVAKTKSSQTTKKKAIVHALDTPHPAPPSWRETYEAIAEMRRQVLAPVDGMGCANAGENEKTPKVRMHMFTSSGSW
jgi:endonuclease-3